jgi:hypothetical protein
VRVLGIRGIVDKMLIVRESYAMIAPKGWLRTKTQLNIVDTVTVNKVIDVKLSVVYFDYYHCQFANSRYTN